MSRTWARDASLRAARKYSATVGPSGGPAGSAIAAQHGAGDAREHEHAQRCGAPRDQRQRGQRRQGDTRAHRRRRRGRRPAARATARTRRLRSRRRRGTPIARRGVATGQRAYRRSCAARHRPAEGSRRTSEEGPKIPPRRVFVARSGSMTVAGMTSTIRARDRDAGAHQALRGGDRRRRRPGPARAPRRGVRVPRPQRRRQDDDAADAARPGAAHVGAGGRARRRARLAAAGWPASAR